MMQHSEATVVMPNFYFDVSFTHSPKPIQVFSLEKALDTVSKKTSAAWEPGMIG